ncbi:hypothetical protein [Kroppenstedtia sanguinis]|uniref:hypothetical protein n=1 Tax=Kroppenstedtia sanguinis TaxID=1380684 RepID=UPI0036D2CCF4
MPVNFYRTRKFRKVALFSFVGTLMISGYVPVAQAPQGHPWSLWGKKAVGSTVSDDQTTKKRIRLSQVEDSDRNKEETQENDNQSKLDSLERSHSETVRTHTTTQQQMSRSAKQENSGKSGTTPVTHPGKEKPVPDDSKPSDGDKPKDPTDNKPQPNPPEEGNPPDNEKPDPESPGEDPEQPGENPEQPGENPDQPGEDPEEPDEDPEQGDGDHSKPECPLKPILDDWEKVE